MEWVHVSKDVEAALEEVRTGGDRAAAIVAAALVEEHLASVIKGFLHQNIKITNDMFRGSGPLGSFSAKINLAFLIGIFSHECHKELETIKEIRNRFAHDLTIKGFDDQRIKDLTNNLTRHESSFTITNPNRETGKRGTLVYAPTPEKSVNARDRYIRSCKFYTAILSMHIPGPVTMPAPSF